VNRKLIALLSLFALLLVVYSSCTRIDTTDIGGDLIPAVDNINTFETTFDVVTDNFLFEDSSRVRSTEDHALGVISNDPVFGSIRAGIYFNVSPEVFGSVPFIPADSIKFPIDSVVLSMAFNGVYGDSTSVQQFEVLEIANDANFKDSTLGYLISHPGVNTNGVLATHTQNFDRLSDDIQVVDGRDTQTVRNQMRIQLNKSLGERLINYDTSVYRNDSAFRISFPGLAIMPVGGTQNALAYFNLKNTDLTRVSVYYKAKSFNGIVDSPFVTHFTFFNFRNINTVERNISGTEYANAMIPGTPNDERIYIASSPGSYATIRIPGLDTLPNSVIHRAELVATTVTEPNPTYQAPFYMFLDAWDSAANLPKTIQNDLTLNSQSGQFNLELFGGFLSNGKYTFDISRYVQGIVTRKEKSYTLRMYAPYKTKTLYIQPGVAANYSVQRLQSEYQSLINPLYLNPQIGNGRTILGGGTHPTSKMRLRIIYSKI
jgi:hypothetical protein